MIRKASAKATQDEIFSTSSRTDRFPSNEGLGIGTPGVEAAAASQGDSGKAGVSAKTVIAGAAAAVAGVAAAGAVAASSKGGSEEQPPTEAAVVPPTTVTTESVVVEAPVTTGVAVPPATETAYPVSEATDLPVVADDDPVTRDRGL